MMIVAALVPIFVLFLHYSQIVPVLVSVESFRWGFIEGLIYGMCGTLFLYSTADQLGFTDPASENMKKHALELILRLAKENDELKATILKELGK